MSRPGQCAVLMKRTTGTRPEKSNWPGPTISERINVFNVSSMGCAQAHQCWEGKELRIYEPWAERRQVCGIKHWKSWRECDRIKLSECEAKGDEKTPFFVKAGIEKWIWREILQRKIHFVVGTLDDLGSWNGSKDWTFFVWLIPHHLVRNWEGFEVWPEKQV